MTYQNSYVFPLHVLFRISGFAFWDVHYYLYCYCCLYLLTLTIQLTPTLILHGFLMTWINGFIKQLKLWVQQTSCLCKQIVVSLKVNSTNNHYKDISNYLNQYSILSISIHQSRILIVCQAWVNYQCWYLDWLPIVSSTLLMFYDHFAISGWLSIVIWSVLHKPYFIV